MKSKCEDLKRKCEDLRKKCEESWNCLDLGMLEWMSKENLLNYVSDVMVVRIFWIMLNVRLQIYSCIYKKNLLLIYHKFYYYINISNFK